MNEPVGEPLILREIENQMDVPRGFLQIRVDVVVLLAELDLQEQKHGVVEEQGPLILCQLVFNFLKYRFLV